MCAAFHRSVDPQRRAARLRRRSTASSPARSAPRSRGPSRSRPRALGRGRAARAARAARLARGRVRRAAVRVRRPRRRGRGPPREADRVAHADRGADDPRQRAGGDAARRAPAARRSTACTSGPTRRGSSCSSQQLESLDVPTPPMPEQMSPQQAADLVGEISRLVAEEVRRSGRGRAAFTSLVLRSLKQAYYSPENIGHAGPREPALLPLHLADPALPGPRRRTARCSPRSAPTTSRRRRPTSTTPGSSASAAEREAMEIERDADDVCLAFLLERALVRARAGGGLGRARSSA